MKETKNYTGCNVKVRWEDLAEDDDEDLNEEPVDYFSKAQSGGSSKKK